MFNRLTPAFLLLLATTQVMPAQDRYPQLSSRENKRIYKDSLGNQVGEAYDFAQPFLDGLAIVTKTLDAQRQVNGAIDAGGKYVLPLQEAFMMNLSGGIIGVDKRGQDYRIYNRRGKEIYSCARCRTKVIEDLNAVLIQEGPGQEQPATTLIDMNGRVMFTMQAERAERVENRRTLTPYTFTPVPTPYFSVVRRVDWRYVNSIVDTSGKIRVDSTENFRFENGLAATRERNRARIVDTVFRDVIPYSAGYDWAMVLPQHPQHLIAARKNGRYGLVDPKNRIILPFRSPYPVQYLAVEKQYRMASSSSDSVYILSFELDTIASPEVRKPEYDRRGMEGPVISRAKGAAVDRYGYRDAKGKMVLPFVFDYLSPAQNDSMLYFRGDTAGYVSTGGRRLFKFPVPCAGAGWFSNGRAFNVKSSGKGTTDGTNAGPFEYGWVDAGGKLIGGQMFGSFAPFVGGRAMVSRGEEYFFVDTLMQRIRLDNKYDYRTYFANDYAVVTDGRHFGIAHRSGKLVLPVAYEQVDAELVAERSGTEFEHAFPIRYIDNTGQGAVAPGSLIIPKILEGKVEVKKSGNRSVVDLSTPDAAASGPVSDTLNQWYKVNPTYLEREEKPGHPMLVKDLPISLLPDRTGDVVRLLSKKTGQPVSQKTFGSIVELNRHGAIALRDGLYSFVSNDGKVLLEDQQMIAWDNGLLEVRNYGPYAVDLPEPHRYCYKSTYYDAGGRKKFEQLWHDHAAFRSDSIAYFRFGRTFSIVGLSGRVYLSERLTEGSPFKAICHNRLIYVLNRDGKVRWVAFDVLKREMFGLTLPDNAEIGPYKVNDTLYGYYDNYGVRRFANAQGRELPFILEPDIVSANEQWGDYFAQEEMVVMQADRRRLGVMNREGRLLVPFKYTAMSAYNQGYAFAQDSLHKRYLINRKGKICLSNIAQEDLYLPGATWQAFTFHEGLALGTYKCRAAGPAGRDGYEERRNCYYYRDTTGKAVLELPAKYAMAGNFSEGLAAVVDREQKLGFVDRQGREVIPCRFPLQLMEEPLPLFRGGYAYLFGQRGYIDSKGKPYFR
jgi:hypothetical protein